MFLKVVLFCSQGLGRIYRQVQWKFYYLNKGKFIGLSNEISFILIFLALLFGRYKFHLAKFNRDINLYPNNKIGLLTSDSARIVILSQKTGAKPSKYTTLQPKDQFLRDSMHTALATCCCKTLRSKIKTISTESMNCQSQDLEARLRLSISRI